MQHHTRRGYEVRKTDLRSPGPGLDSREVARRQEHDRPAGTGESGPA